MDASFLSVSNLPDLEVYAIPTHAAWDENTGANENLHEALTVGASIDPEPNCPDDESPLGYEGALVSVPLLSPMLLAESEAQQTRHESQVVDEASGARSMVQAAAGQLELGALQSCEENDEEEESESFLDPVNEPESGTEDEIIADIGLAQNVVIRLATEVEHDSDDDDSAQEAPHNLVSGLLGRIGLRAMLRGGMHRAPR
jgi:hypothetical protein